MQNLTTPGLYAGKTIGAIGRTWTGNSRVGVPGYNPTTVVTPQMMRDRDFMIPFMKAIASGEAPGSYPMDQAQWNQAFDWYMAGGVPPGEQALGRGQTPAQPTPAPVVVDLGPVASKDPSPVVVELPTPQQLRDAFYSHPLRSRNARMSCCEASRRQQLRLWTKEYNAIDQRDLGTVVAPRGIRPHQLPGAAGREFNMQDNPTCRMGYGATRYL
jgi:hypothetical protein